MATDFGHDGRTKGHVGHEVAVHNVDCAQRAADQLEEGVVWGGGFLFVFWGVFFKLTV